MDGLLAITIVLLVYALGDFVSYKTKSIVSMMFVASVVFMVSFWFGLPKTIFEDAQLLGFGSLMIAFLITHMGTLMSFKDLKKQWKTVLISISAVIGIGVFLFFVGTPIIGKEYAVASAPPISGGVVAAIIMGDAAKAKGLEAIAVFATLLVVVQGFFGYPVASFLLNKEAKKLIKVFRENSSEVASTLDDTISDMVMTKNKLIPSLPKDLQTSFVLLAKLALVALLGFKLSDFTNGLIHKYVMCLLVGIAGRELGFLEENIMTKANAFGLALLGLMAIVVGNLSKATPEMLLSILFPMVISLLLGLVGIAIASILVGKILGYSIEMSIAIGTSALFGFPGTYILSNEVANANGKTDEERQFLLNEILPKMLVAGFMTVTIASVVLAGFMAKLM
ncbi:hypothetical protein KQI38_04440 [Tissierella carlieri]|uniref:Na+/glutamate symporter n=1 Tax=Tissierella carlieri TaxID=689904 RepID=A0ABT1SFX2_9FIRM|nr:hypothetical protein [Tissierella carlieri]MBU5311264.1 hypothetical protein [Tissierella carlieri]MCQ4925393.1 hypothetical protein [Tissierella carlieri]